MSNDIGAQFAKHFFGLFDKKDYGGLVKLFQNNSILSFEKQNRQGAQKIVELFQAFNQKYSKTQHTFTADTLETPEGSKLIFVTGRRLDNQHQNITNGVLFCCTAILQQSGSSFYVSNLIYRGEAAGINIPSNDMKVGSQFIQKFYEVYDKDAKNLAGVYTPQTRMKYETDNLQGVQMIMCKLTAGASDEVETKYKRKLQFRSVRFKTVKHDLQMLDIHPGGGKGCLIAQVGGWLAPDGSNKPVKFGEVFILSNSGGWKVGVQAFRQIY
eukprot:CAMPEP_0197514846 /NCGR_PEP_ID=MMETSP1318-20131121/159_1 /TAXON_ID=552666 /ORGANISM="Partenskyella glossopodia, Strain RCC365" /LENGTH=268 /DNA_ID=CAMNT_0043063049 /DNA_START=105 /DNA_END=911 /DNA_ORIENTATION=+